MQYIAKSKRYIPEVVNYLISCSGCFCNGEGIHVLHVDQNLLHVYYTYMLMYM